MTILLIGGMHQGKRALAARLFGLSETDFADGATCTREELSAAPALDGLHRLTRRMLAAGEEPATLQPLLEDKIVLCDQLGCGVVPADRASDDWREATGRLCCDLAARAELVVRVTAGLPQVLKGALPCD